MATPRKHPPRDAAAMVENLAAQGFALIGIAKHFTVSASTLRRWMDEDESLREAFEVGRETERRELHALIKRDAVAGKSANANAMFLLKCRHGYREFDSPNTKVDVAVQVAQPVMLVRDHGTDEEWAAKVAQQQRQLMATEPKTIEAGLPEPQSALQTHERPAIEVVPVPSTPAILAPPVGPKYGF